MNFLLLLLGPFLGYLLGSISSAIVVSKAMGLPDPRSMGSGNPGATNVLRTGNKLAAGLTLLGDVLKGIIPVVVAASITKSPIIIALTGLGAFLGHLYPLFFGFKGGKGVATAGGVFLGLSPAVSGLMIITWLGAALAFRYSSLAALIAATVSPVFIFFLKPQFPYIALAIAIAVILFWRHKENIQRLRRGEESKIVLSR